MELRVVGLDPSVRNTGIVRARVLLPSLEVLVDGIHLVKTESGAGKQVRKNSDDLRRAQEIQDAFIEVIQEHRPTFFISEIPTGAQSARAAWLLGMTVGCIAALKHLNMPLIQVQPSETKIASVGKKTASKQEIIDWAIAKYPKLPWLRYKHKGEMKLTADNEHMADAVAVIHAGVLTAEFQQAIALLGGITRAA
jgi:Holliday junction resolvasome RuvABC endonuclease subunit